MREKKKKKKKYPPHPALRIEAALLPSRDVEGGKGEGVGRGGERGGEGGKGGGLDFDDHR